MTFSKTRILAFAGSTRSESWNKKMLVSAVDGARAAGAEVTSIDLRDHVLPLYDGDLEEREGIPSAVRELKRHFAEHHGFLISSAEYNGSISAVLKNTIDWVSRPMEGEAPLAGFRGKVAALMSASPGGFGGMRGLVHVRAILGNIGVFVLPDQVCLPHSHEAIGPDGRIRDERVRQSVEKLGATLVSVTGKLNVY